MILCKATASRIDLTCGHQLAREYLSHIADLLDAPEVSSLMHYRHHKMNRCQHSLNVSWYGFLLARRLHMDAAAVARSGLLHDLFYYNFRDEPCSKSEHIYAHPQLALENARQLCDLSEKEEDIVLNHMWPMCPEKRRHHRETYLVACIDKCCCLLELGAVALSCSKRASLRVCRAIAAIF